MDVLIDGEIVLHGLVGTDYWLDDSSFDARSVITALAQLGRNTDVVVRVNSPGGDAQEGAAIYGALSAHKGRVTVVIEGQACSAASLLAMAGDEIRMRRGSVMMIHDPSMITWGTAADHEKSIEALTALASTYADVYAERSGNTPEEARADMREEIWLTPEEAVERGYADATDDTEAIEPVAFNYRQFRNAPEPLVALADQRGWSRATRMMAAPAASPRPQEKSPMATTPAGNHPAPDTATASQQPADIDRIRSEATATAASSERARIQAIMDCDEAKGREDLARHFAFATDMAPEAAKAALAKAPTAAAPAPAPAPNRFEAAMAAAGNPTVGADPVAPASDTPEAVAASIIALHRGAMGTKRSA